MDSFDFIVQSLSQTTSYFHVKLLGSKKPQQVKAINLGLPCRTILSNRILTNFFGLRSRNHQIGSRRNWYVQSRRVHIFVKLETTDQPWAQQRTLTVAAINKFCGCITTEKLLKSALQTSSLFSRARTVRKQKS